MSCTTEHLHNTEWGICFETPRTTQQ